MLIIMHVHAYTVILMYVQAHTHDVQCIQIHMYIRILMYMQAHACTCKHMHINVHANTCTLMYMQAQHINVHAGTCTTHVYIHMHFYKRDII